MTPTKPQHPPVVTLFDRHTRAPRSSFRRGRSGLAALGEPAHSRVVRGACLSVLTSIKVERRSNAKLIGITIPQARLFVEHDSDFMGVPARPVSGRGQGSDRAGERLRRPQGRRAPTGRTRAGTSSLGEQNSGAGCLGKGESMTKTMATTWLLAGALISAGAGAMENRVARVDVAGATLILQPLADADLVTVSVSGPEGYAFSRTFGRGQAPTLTLADGATTLRDGLYMYEIALGRSGAPRPEAGAGGTTGRQPAVRQSGHFTVVGGSVLLPNAAAKEPGSSRPAPTPDDFLINDDLVVIGATCSGFDCVNNEVFGFENLLLKQNNNRIRADDTSVSAGFANNDWELRFNDDASGGLNRFALVDLTGAKVPMSVLAGAPTDSLVVDGAGNVGVGTAAPLAEIHVKDGDTPDLRIEQDGSSGFTPQAWDVAGNESNFFVRDVTGGNTLPFRIRPGAPSSSIDILGATGNVGMGTGAAAATLHVTRNTGNTRVLVEETSTTTASRNMLRIVNNGASTFRFDTTTGLPSWGFGSLGTGNFFISGTGVAGLSMQMTNTGNMTILGTLTQLSDRNAKEGIQAIDADALLGRVDALPLSTWSYKNDNGKIRHLGPMAQDFAAAFGLGPDDTHVAPSDVAGVSLAAVQGLNRKLEQRLREKDTQLEALEARLLALEALMHAAAR